MGSVSRFRNFDCGNFFVARARHRGAFPTPPLRPESVANNCGHTPLTLAGLVFWGEAAMLGGATPLISVRCSQWTGYSEFHNHKLRVRSIALGILYGNKRKRVPKG